MCRDLWQAGKITRDLKQTSVVNFNIDGDVFAKDTNHGKIYFCFLYEVSRDSRSLFIW